MILTVRFQLPRCKSRLRTAKAILKLVRRRDARAVQVVAWLGRRKSDR